MVRRIFLSRQYGLTNKLSKNYIENQGKKDAGRTPSLDLTVEELSKESKQGRGFQQFLLERSEKVNSE